MAPMENGMAQTDTSPGSKEAAKDAASPKDSLEIRDTRTGKTYNLPVATQGVEGDTFIKAMDLRPVKQSPDEFGLLSQQRAAAALAARQRIGT